MSQDAPDRQSTHTRGHSDQGINDANSLGPEYRQRITPIGQSFLSPKRLEPVSRQSIAVLDLTPPMRPFGIIQHWSNESFGNLGEAIAPSANSLVDYHPSPFAEGLQTRTIQPDRLPSDPSSNTPLSPTPSATAEIPALQTQSEANYSFNALPIQHQTSSPSSDKVNPNPLQRQPEDAEQPTSPIDSLAPTATPDSQPSKQPPPVQISKNLRLPTLLQRSPHLQHQVKSAKAQILRSLQSQSPHPPTVSDANPQQPPAPSNKEPVIPTTRQPLDPRGAVAEPPPRSSAANLQPGSAVDDGISPANVGDTVTVSSNLNDSDIPESQTLSQQQEQALSQPPLSPSFQQKPEATIHPSARSNLSPLSATNPQPPIRRTLTPSTVQPPAVSDLHSEVDSVEANDYQQSELSMAETAADIQTDLASPERVTPAIVVEDAPSSNHDFIQQHSESSQPPSSEIDSSPEPGLPLPVENTAPSNHDFIQQHSESSQPPFSEIDSSPEPGLPLPGPSDPSLQREAEHLTSDQLPEMPVSSENKTALNPQIQSKSATSAASHQPESTIPSEQNSPPEETRNRIPGRRSIVGGMQDLMGAFVNRKSISSSPTHSSLPIQRESKRSEQSQFSTPEIVSQAAAKPILPIQPETKSKVDQASVPSSSPMQAKPGSIPPIHRRTEIGNNNTARDSVQHDVNFSGHPDARQAQQRSQASSDSRTTNTNELSLKRQSDAANFHASVNPQPTETNLRTSPKPQSQDSIPDQEDARLASEAIQRTVEEEADVSSEQSETDSQLTFVPEPTTIQTSGVDSPLTSDGNLSGSEDKIQRAPLADSAASLPPTSVVNPVSDASTALEASVWQQSELSPTQSAAVQREADSATSLPPTSVVNPVSDASTALEASVRQQPELLPTQSAAVQKETTLSAQDLPATVEDASSLNHASIQRYSEPTHPVSLETEDSSEPNLSLPAFSDPSIQREAEQPSSVRLTSERLTSEPPLSEQSPSEQSPSEPPPSEPPPSEPPPSEQSPSEPPPSEPPPSEQSPSEPPPSEQSPSGQLASEMQVSSEVITTQNPQLQRIPETSAAPQQSGSVISSKGCNPGKEQKK